MQRTTEKGTHMSNHNDTSRSLLHRLGGVGPARVRAFGGTGAGGRALNLLLLTLGVLAFTAGPAQAAVIHEYIGSEEPSAYTPFPGAGSEVVVDESTSLTDWAKGDTYETIGVKPTEGLSGSAIAVFTPARKKIGELSARVGEIAIQDTTGDLIVNYGGLEGVGSVESYEPTMPGAWAPPIEVRSPTFGNSQFGRSFGALAVDESSGEATSGEIYDVGALNHVADKYRIEEFSAGHAYLGMITGTCEKAKEVLPCPGSRLIPLPGFGSTSGTSSISVDPATHDLYADVGAAVDIFGPDIVVPDLTTGAVSDLKGMSAVLDGTVNPLDEGPASCQFVWGTTKSFGHTVACTEDVVEGDSAVPVHSVRIEGLAPDTEYCYRLQAANKAKGANAGGTNVGEESEDRCFTTPGPKDAEGSVTQVTADSATFDATVAPRGASTSFYVQYSTSGTEACGAEPSLCIEVPAAPGLDVGAGESPASGEEPVQGLSPSTLYHYRAVEVREPEPGETEEIAGPDETFTTQLSGPGFALPDGRQYQLVSLPVKRGAFFRGAQPGEGEIGETVNTMVTEAAASGDAFAAEASQPSEAEPQGNANGEIVLMSRGADGAWSSRVISAPHREETGVSLGLGQEVRMFSADLAQAVVDPFGSFTPLSPEAVEQTAYLRTNFSSDGVEARCEGADASAQSCYRPLVTRANTAPGTEFGYEFKGRCTIVDCGPVFLAGNASLSDVILGARAPLTETPVVVHESTSARDLLGEPADYEWHEGALTLVNFLPGASEGGGVDVSWRNGDKEHLVSASGHYVVLEGVGGEEATGQLYLRDVVKGETVQLSAPEAGCGSCASGGRYQTANAEDTRVFFLGNVQRLGIVPNRLTSDSSAPTQFGSDLYECEMVEEAGKDRCNLSDLTPEASGESSNVQSVLGASEDGSYVYFVAGGVLAPGATRQACIDPGIGVFGGCNLYVRHNGMTSFVAELSGTDLVHYELSIGSAETFGSLRARVSPDGRWLAFMSNRSLTGHDNRDAASGTPDEEVYLYHAPEDLASGQGSVTCASCNPTGARPVGVAGLAASVPQSYGNGGSFERESTHQPRYLEDSGRLFFDAKDALVPSDTNGVIDVYEYEPEGVPAGEHACSSAAQSASEVFKPASGYEVEGVKGREGAGCVALISSGTSLEPSTFLDASESGGDVFFLTGSRLTTNDVEGGLSIFDAQECTSATPCLPEAPVSPPPCETEASCKASPTPQPSVYGAPASATFSGPGNLVPEIAPPPTKKVVKKTVQCKKNFAKNKQGQCVRRKSKRKAKKSSTERRVKR